ncbi:MAG: hypothetical protein LUD72_07635 [Bacteroidales bacterium]|nr:hypothetical protein [Bacteroidales bacterium]
MAKRVFKKKAKEGRSSMRGRMALGLGSIAIVLLLTCIISNFGYSRMRTRVSDLLSRNIECVNTVRELGTMCEEYNMGVLDALKDGTAAEGGLAGFNTELFLERCDSLGVVLETVHSAFGEIKPGLVDSLKANYWNYVLSSVQLQEEVAGGLEDGFGAYFVALEPQYYRLCESIDDVAEAVYERFQWTSEEFRQGTYSGMTSVFVTAVVGILLLLLLLFFISVYYVNPVYRMLKNLENSVIAGTKYRYDFEGSDQLSQLNEQITDIVEENVDLRRRARVLSEENESLREAVRAAEE